MKQLLFGKTLDELKEVTRNLGLPKYAANQIADWLYAKGVGSVDEMSNLSQKARFLLREQFDSGVQLPQKVQVSSDGTKKYLFATEAGKYIETAMIPEEGRITVCVSSQIGCKMGCLFCMTGKQGFQGQLTAGEIVNQIRSIEEAGHISNIVYMGMGEPFDNLTEVLKSIDILTAPWGYAMSPRRITVSTIGIIPAMITFLEKSEAHLAVSMHSPFDEERKQLMPVQVAYPITDVIREIRKWDFSHQRRVSFEYIMFKNLNDTEKHVRELARLLNGMSCRINLIRFHPIPATPLQGSDDNTIFAFKDMLNDKGILTTLRASRGLDIYAACGLLSTREMLKNE
jgi:23S rRNA (adenine2503-C2)-methyltransferase